VVVIGGGIIGCSIAWRLAQTGRRVAVVERGRVAGEASSAAGGILMPIAHPDLSPQLLSLYLRSLADYPRFVAEVREATGQPFEFRITGRLEVGLNEDEVARLRTIYAYQEPADIRAQWLNRQEAREIEPLLTPEVQAAVLYPDHGVVDNGRLTRAIATALRDIGGDVFESRLVTGLAVANGEVSGVETPTGRVSAPLVVNCAGSWSGLVDPRASAPVRPAKGEMLAVDLGGVTMRCQVGGIGGSASSRIDGRTFVAATRYDAGFDKDVVAGSIFGLFQRSVRLVPRLAEARFLETWAGLRPACPDSLPIIGFDPEIGGLLWATGHLGMGILSAPTTATAVVDLVESGRSRVPIDQFGIERFPCPPSRPVVAV
jgi:glycine oxidase